MRFSELCVDGIIPRGKGKGEIITIIMPLSSNRLWGLSFQVQVSGGACLSPTAEVWGVPKPRGALSSHCPRAAGVTLLCAVPCSGVWDEVCAHRCPREGLLGLFFTPWLVVAGVLGKISWCEEPVPDQGRFVAPSKKLQPHARVLR